MQYLGVESCWWEYKEQKIDNCRCRTNSITHLSHAVTDPCNNFGHRAVACAYFPVEIKRSRCNNPTSSRSSIGACPASIAANALSCWLC
jgi:hypothetical protein